MVVGSNHQNSINQTTTQLYFQCRDPPFGIKELIANITIHLIDCPLGLVYENKTKQCRCALQNSDTFLCSVQLGQNCIKNGYWYTHSMNKPIVTKCPYHSYCDFKGTLCPNKLEFVVVPRNQDDQCRDGHGGTLCMNCGNHKTFTYLAVNFEYCLLPDTIPAENINTVNETE